MESNSFECIWILMIICIGVIAYIIVTDEKPEDDDFPQGPLGPLI